MAPSLKISIPNASVLSPLSGAGKPYTAYTVVLQLPLRKHQLPKRYSDFTTLHAELTAQTGAAPPAPLPPKSWLRSTINNDGLTETRRQGLEAYLTAILEAGDARWRSSPAWRAFLNLPSGTATAAERSNGGTSSPSRPKSAGAALGDPNLWLDAHRTLKTQIQAARSQLKQRDAASTGPAQHALSAEAKASLLRAATNIAQLDDGLRAITMASHADDAGWGGAKKLGEGEIRRRRDLLSAARKEVEGLEAVLKNMATKSAHAANSGATSTAGDKEALWKGTNAAKPGGRVLGGPALKETERTRERDNAGVLQLQQQVMQEQEEDVLSLGQTVSRLKDMGIMINEELTIQNEMLGLVEQDTDRVQSKIDIARKRIGKIS